MSKTDNDEKERIANLANHIENLLQFSAFLIPDLDLLEKASKHSSEISGTTMAMAPLLGAVGEDWESKQLEADIRLKRSKAIVNLVKVIKETEDERAKFADGQASKAKARAELSKILGGI